MIGIGEVYSSMLTNDIAAAREFYGDKLGLDTRVEAIDGMGEMLWITHPGGAQTLIYPKEDHVAATHTILNFVSDDFESTMADLRSRGVTFETNDWTEEGGVARDPSGATPPRAWFRDPAGNWASVSGK